MVGKLARQRFEENKRSTINVNRLPQEEREGYGLAVAMYTKSIIKDEEMALVDRLFTSVDHRAATMALRDLAEGRERNVQDLFPLAKGYELKLLQRNYSAEGPEFQAQRYKSERRVFANLDSRIKEADRVTRQLMKDRFITDPQKARLMKGILLKHGTGAIALEILRSHGFDNPEGLLKVINEIRAKK